MVGEVTKRYPKNWVLLIIERSFAIQKILLISYHGLIELLQMLKQYWQVLIEESLKNIYKDISLKYVIGSIVDFGNEKHSNVC